MYANLAWQPPESYHLLATAWDDHALYEGKAKQPTPGTGIDQPMLWTVNFGKGRVFVTALGHDAPAIHTPDVRRHFHARSGVGWVGHRDLAGHAGGRQVSEETKVGMLRHCLATAGVPRRQNPARCSAAVRFVSLRPGRENTVRDPRPHRRSARLGAVNVRGEAGMARFHAARMGSGGGALLRRGAGLDDRLASAAEFRLLPEQFFQGPIADALTHTGQLAMLRRLGGWPVRGENYFVPSITAGRVGPDQAAPRKEFD